MTTSQERQHEIEYFLGSVFSPATTRKFDVAIRTFLSRIPNEVLDEIRDCFFIDATGASAFDVLAVPCFESMVSSHKGRGRRKTTNAPVLHRKPFVVIGAGFNSTAKKDGVGLIAHELGHMMSWVLAGKPDDTSGGAKEEERADELAIGWGFAEEIEVLNRELPHWHKRDHQEMGM